MLPYKTLNIILLSNMKVFYNETHMSLMYCNKPLQLILSPSDQYNEGNGGGMQLYYYIIQSFVRIFMTTVSFWIDSTILY